MTIVKITVKHDQLHLARIFLSAMIFRIIFDRNHTRGHKCKICVPGRFSSFFPSTNNFSTRMISNSEFRLVGTLEGPFFFP